MPSIQQFNVARARSYVFRLPLFTRAMIVIILGLWILSVPRFWNLQQWGALIPSEVSFTSGKKVLT